MKSKTIYAGVGILVVVVVVSAVMLGFPLRDDGKTDNGNQDKGELAMFGDIGDFIQDEVDDPAHDPAIIKDQNTYYVFSTGKLQNQEDPGGIYIRKSEGTLEGEWEAIGEIPAPDWIKEYGPNHLWAPQVVKREDEYYLYYATSSFGSNNSAIGAASSKTPGDPESWIDHGPVFTSQQGSEDYNAIDPHVFEADDSWWIAFGSHFSGIKLQKMASQTEVEGEIYTLANRPGVAHNPIEAPTIIEKGNYFYLFTSWDQCCNGTDSTYKIAVGRSESVTGPYVDKDGVPLEEGGGTVILSTKGDQIGPGGQDILQEGDIDYLIYHYYDGDADGVIRMQIRSLDWQEEWPKQIN
ncbi:arabinan endo-1,5-alpha-L-arabinosidase [Salipaludibacillus sp. CF4.18]|uniref:arabinan endo-1,5-alpha-L-arabinosidase n=1 Tax=Salipaludibacillus sp. CF4.18 TaxID=3373081 RepID=UPI003EE63E0B